MLNAVKVLFLFLGLVAFGEFVVLEHVDYQKAKQYEKRETEKKQSKSAAVSLTFNQAKPDTAKKAAPDTTEHTDEKLEVVRDISEYTRRIARFNLWLVIATIVLAIIGAYQGRQMRLTVVGAEEVAKKQLRAYLGVSGGAVNVIARAAHIQGAVEVRNTGKTPAKQVTKAIEAEIRDAKNPGVFKPPTTEPSRAVIVPGGYWTFRKDLEITEAVWQDLLAYRKAMFVWGHSAYVDEFGDLHTLEFRYRNRAARFTLNERQEKTIFGWDLEPEEEGNDTR